MHVPSRVGVACARRRLAPRHGGGRNPGHELAQNSTLVWLGIVTALVARSWPYTLNHILLEGIVLGLLVLFPVRFELAGTHEAPDPFGPTGGFFNDGSEATVGRHAW
jgi:hypothetical protein